MPVKPETTQPLNSQTELAVERNWLAMERNLLAWLRTALTLITFGFSIHHFFRAQTLEEARHMTPSEFGFYMILVGQVGLLLAIWQYRRDVRSLMRRYPPWQAPISYSILAAGLVCLLAFVGLGYMLVPA